MSIAAGVLGALGLGGAGWLAWIFIGPKKLLELATAVLAFIRANWKLCALAAAVLVAFLYVRHLRHEVADARADAARGWSLFHQEQTAFRQTVANVRSAVAAAKKANEDNVTRIETEQDTKTQEVSREYQARLADLRRRYDAGRLRSDTAAQGGRAPDGAAGTVQGSRVSHPSGGPDASASARDLQFNAEANAIQLEELQKWIRDQQAIKR